MRVVSQNLGLDRLMNINKSESPGKDIQTDKDTIRKKAIWRYKQFDGPRSRIFSINEVIYGSTHVIV